MGETENISIPSVPPPEAGKIQEEAIPTDVHVLLPESSRGLEQYPVTEAVRIAAESGAFRSPGTKVFLQALCQLRETDLSSAREERQAAEKSIAKLNDDYHSEHLRRSVLEERLRCGVPMKKLQNIMITLGGILFGAGVQPLVNSFSITYCIFAILGLAMLFFGWSHPNNREEDKS